MQEQSKFCTICLDVSIDPDLEGCDLSYHGVGRTGVGYRFLIKSGAGKPMAILFEKHENGKWNTIGIYEPLCCPVCGRLLKEDDEE